MNPTRQLAAIMFTDIVGYTALMGANEKRALKLLKANREVHKKYLKEYKGKWLKEMGDGILASFPTISDAVYCAGAIQQATHDVPDLELRIGIHVGEIVIENDDVFGDGVNIASRIEALAPPREIWVSESVYNNIKNKEGISLNFVRDETLKNVDDPVKIFSVDVDKDFDQKYQAPNPSGQQKKGWLKLAAMVIGIMIVLLLAVNILYFTPGGQTNAGVVDKSIAVVPFKNLTQDQNNNFFSDGMMEAILNNLSKVEELKVMSRNSTEQYRGSTKSASEIADEMEVGNILSGSVQQAGNKVRVNVQLTQGNNEVVWSESYDRQISDVFELQSEIAQTVASQLQAILSSEAIKLIENRPTENLEAYEFYLKGLDILNNASNDNETEASASFFQKALELDPDFADCYVSLARIYSGLHFDLSDGSTSVKDSIYSLLDKALKLNPDLPEAYKFKAWYTFFALNNPDQAIANARKALALDPNDAESYYILGYTYLFMAPPDYESAYENIIAAAELEKGENVQGLYETIGFLHVGTGNFEKAEEYYLKGIEINPETADYNRIWWMNLIQGNFEEALKWAKKGYSIDPDDDEYVNQMARTYMYLGDYEKSKVYYEQWQEILNPDEYGDLNFEVFNIGYGFTNWQLGNKEIGKEVFNSRIEHGEKVFAAGIWDGGGGELYEQARIYSVLGHKDKAYEYLHQLEKTEFPFGSLNWMNIDPMFENIRDEEEFQTILQKGFALKADIRVKIELVEQNQELKQVLNR